MVKLNRIYTRTGDDGTTGLATGARVRKDDPAVEAYGTVDETSAALGLAVLATSGAGETGAELRPLLQRIQNDLFDLGADLATPISPGEQPGKALRTVASQTGSLEREIDRFNERLSPLTSFVLPGGSSLGAALHLARTVCRRAERLAVTLSSDRPGAINQEAIRYLNRLSDLLFVLARVANDNGRSDVLWVPGANR
ncbi:MAG: cob(I)yrinic acid a,c-diamide adenosyltransferase [Phycisphaerales bacterium]|nr:cob(I)yrinic acid a,c-diamide adenosyltransferase [Phycisphaerales bacterium]